MIQSKERGHVYPSMSGLLYKKLIHADDGYKIKDSSWLKIDPQGNYVGKYNYNAVILNRSHEQYRAAVQIPLMRSRRGILRTSLNL